MLGVEGAWGGGSGGGGSGGGGGGSGGRGAPFLNGSIIGVNDPRLISECKAVLYELLVWI